jgi:hypothetical protein
MQQTRIVVVHALRIVSNPNVAFLDVPRMVTPQVVLRKSWRHPFVVLRAPDILVTARR